MIFLICLVLAIIIAIISLKAVYPKLKDAEVWIAHKSFWKALIVPIIILSFGLFNPFKVERVDAGNVGVMVWLVGDNRGISKYEYRTGWVVYNKWTSKLYEFPTYQQHIEYDEQTIISRGGFSAAIKPSFNYRIKAGNVGDMFQNLRVGIKQVEKEWLQTAIVGAVNDVANLWTVDSIFNNREKFELNIINKANNNVKQWFEISQLRTNIVPPKELANSIIEKTKAIQQVQVAENQKLVEIAEAQSRIAKAKGDSAQAVITAAGEARAMQLKQLTLTPEYIEYMKVQKWNGVNSQVITGGGGLIMNLK